MKTGNENYTSFCGSPFPLNVRGIIHLFQQSIAYMSYSPSNVPSPLNTLLFAIFMLEPYGKLTSI